VLIATVDVAGAFQSQFQEQCAQAEVAYVPAVVVCTRSRVSQAGPTTGDERKTAKTSKKDEKTTKPADDKAGRALGFLNDKLAFIRLPTVELVMILCCPILLTAGMRHDFNVHNKMPNTHRRRRRDETVLSRRVGVGGVYMNSRRLPTDSNAQHSRRRPVYNSAANGSRLPTGVFTPTTRQNCRQLVANSCTHRRRDATRQFRLVGVGGVYWA